jgi:hypothetical protein
MNSATTTQNGFKIKYGLNIIYTVMLGLLIFLSESTKLNAQPADLTTSGDLAYYANSDSYGGRPVDDWPLLDVIPPNTFKLVFSDDGKYFVLSKIRANNQNYPVEALQPLGMQYAPQIKEIRTDNLMNLKRDTNAFFVRYNQLLNLIPEDIFDEFTGNYKKQIYPLFAGIENYRLMIHYFKDQSYLMKIVTHNWILKLRFSNEGTLVHALKKNRYRTDDVKEKEITEEFDINVA